MEDLVLGESSKDVIHRRSAAFGGKEVERSDRGVAAEHLLLEILMDYLFAQGEHPVGRGIMVPEDRVDHLGEKIVARYLQDTADMLEYLPEECDARRTGLLRQEILKALRQSFLNGDGPKSRSVRRAL